VRRVVGCSTGRDIIGDEPGVRTGRLDDSSAAERFKAPDMGADKSLRVTARDSDTAILDQGAVQAWAILAAHPTGDSAKG
jgi:hypothetical protein